MRKILLSMCLILIAGCSAQPDEKPKETPEEKMNQLLKKLLILKKIFIN